MKVLDKGSVELIDHMGTDLSVVDAARVSFSKGSEWLRNDAALHGYTQSLHRRKDAKWLLSHDERMLEWVRGIVYPCLNYEDRGLINYLAREGHWTPFGQVNVKLRIKMPIFVARQAMRTNVGVVWNEESRRYIDSEPEFYEPEVWRGRPEGSIKQGSGNVVEYSNAIPAYEYLSSEEIAVYEYKDRLAQGVAPEMARMVLPQSTYTTVIANFTLAAAARFCGLRSDSHAQLEIQQYANAMSELISPLFPVSWAALTGGE